MTKAIVLDMDGTLLTSEKKISERTLKALIAAQESGIKLILASGRPVAGMQAYAKELKMDQYEGALIAYNGAQTYLFESQQIVYKQELDMIVTQALLKHLNAFNVIPMLYHDDYIVVNDVFAGDIHLPEQTINIIEYEARSNGLKLMEVEDLAEFVTNSMPKILIAGQPDYLNTHHQSISQPFLEQTTSAFSAPFYYEFTAQGIHKATSLEKVLVRYSIPKEATIAFGDGENDLTILELAGVGVAMGNANELVKQVCQQVTLSNDDDGIAIVIEDILQ